MSNEEKARYIISEWNRKNEFMCNTNDIQAFGVALEMAAWKDEWVKRVLDEVENDHYDDIGGSAAFTDLRKRLNIE